MPSRRLWAKPRWRAMNWTNANVPRHLWPQRLPNDFRNAVLSVRYRQHDVSLGRGNRCLQQRMFMKKTSGIGNHVQHPVSAVRAATVRAAIYSETITKLSYEWSLIVKTEHIKPSLTCTDLLRSYTQFGMTKIRSTGNFKQRKSTKDQKFWLRVTWFLSLLV